MKQTPAIPELYFLGYKEQRTPSADYTIGLCLILLELVIYLIVYTWLDSRYVRHGVRTTDRTFFSVLKHAVRDVNISKSPWIVLFSATHA